MGLGLVAILNDGIGLFKEDIYRSENRNGSYLAPVKLSSSLNTPRIESWLSISSDEQEMLLFSRNRDFEPGLYYSYMLEAEWQPRISAGDLINSQAKYIGFTPRIGHLVFLCDSGFRLIDRSILDMAKSKQLSFVDNLVHTYWAASDHEQGLDQAMKKLSATIEEHKPFSHHYANVLDSYAWKAYFRDRDPDRAYVLLAIGLGAFPASNQLQESMARLTSIISE